MPEMPQHEVNRLSVYDLAVSKYGGTPEKLGQKIDEIQSAAIKALADLPDARKLIPAEGDVVLVRDAAKDHEEFVKLGVEPAEVSKEREGAWTVTAEYYYPLAEIPRPDVLALQAPHFQRALVHGGKLREFLCRACGSARVRAT